MSLRSWSVAAALVIMLLVAYGTWLEWNWKAMIGWQPLVDYIDPNGATGRKDAVQVYAVLVAGVIASITAIVGLVNLRLTRKNLEQQRELEAQRAEQQRKFAQGTALQAYYEQIGKLLTEYRLRSTELKEIRELARGQTLTVLREVDVNGRGSLLTFLHSAGLIGAENPAVSLSGAFLEYVRLQGFDLQEAILQRASLTGAYLAGATLQEAILIGADLQGAILIGADLQGADLRDAKVSDKQLAGASSLQGVTMPNGSKHS